jgi:hypothetical protein
MQSIEVMPDRVNISLPARSLDFADPDILCRYLMSCRDCTSELKIRITEEIITMNGARLQRLCRILDWDHSILNIKNAIWGSDFQKVKYR